MAVLHRIIFSFISRATIISLLLCFSFSVSAQQKKMVTVAEEDTIPLFRGIAISADLVGIGMMTLYDYGTYEAALRINLKDKYFPVVEVGIGKADADDDVTRLVYKTTAPFGRIGLDLNFLKNKHDDYRVYGGLRYAFTSFKYDLQAPTLTDPVWGGFVPYGGKDLSSSCHWTEFNVGIDAKIWGPLRLGWNYRYKRRIQKKKTDMGHVWYIPGYGKDGAACMVAQFNVIFEI